MTLAGSGMPPVTPLGELLPVADSVVIRMMPNRIAPKTMTPNSMASRSFMAQDWPAAGGRVKAAAA